jgi:parallel beta-helix repeat protein
MFGYCKNNVASCNNITNNGIGIYLSLFCSENIFRDNDITNNTAYGFEMERQTGENKIYHNNFNNAYQIFLYSSAGNYWDDGYPSGGNRWSDYTDADMYKGPYQNITGSDGIGDANYTVGGLNVDGYPLLPPYPMCDIGITETSKAKDLVGQGCDMNISVTVVNIGINTENFNVTAYANTTIIETKNITLTSRNSTTLIFTWNTSSLDKGNYTIKIAADILQGESDAADNIQFGGFVNVTIPGDVTGDIWVDMLDIDTLVDNFLVAPPAWNPYCDVNNDLTIDMADISIAIDHFMQP